MKYEIAFVAVVTLIFAGLFMSVALALESSSTMWKRGYNDGYYHGTMGPGQQTQSYIDGFNAGLAARKAAPPIQEYSRR
jgi:hypothetical protein